MQGKEREAIGMMLSYMSVLEKKKHWKEAEEKDG